MQYQIGSFHKKSSQGVPAGQTFQKYKKQADIGKNGYFCLHTGKGNGVFLFEPLLFLS
jgi:hypothetical protein